MQKHPFTSENHLFVHILTLILPIFTVNLTNTNRRLLSITFFQAASHTWCLQHSNVSFSLENRRYTCIYTNRKIKAFKFTACSPETFLSRYAIRWLWRNGKGARVTAWQAVMCSTLPACGRWVLGSDTHGFREAQKLILLFGCDPVLDGKLVCLKYVCSRARERHTLLY